MRAFLITRCIYFFKRFCLVFSVGFMLCCNANAFERLTEKEWHYTYNFCMQNNANACDYLIDNGLVGPQECLDKQCEIVGMIYTLAGRHDEALAYFEKLCESGNVASCGNVGDIYYFHLHDYFRARDFYERSCKQKNSASCYGLGIMYGNGEGVRQSFDKEDNFYKQACNGKEPLGCYNLGVMYQQKTDMKNHLSIAKEFYGKACDYGYQSGCDKYREFNEIGIK
ncbi:tetratricopeptide repeat protein [Helicobacter bilis]|nr:tetratricopeptide repeat protein [Helicobacter bilis]